MSSILISTLTKLGREAGRLVLPSPCIICGEELPWGGRVASCCRRCWNGLAPIADPRCSGCATIWHGGDRRFSFTCLECQKSPPPMEWTDAWGEYRGGLELLLRALKFEGHDFLASALATLLAAVPSLHKPDAPGLDCVAAVPMHSRKLRHRGYNQADLLARHLARRVGVPYEPRMLVKQLDGVPQSTLPREERRRNVRRAFAGSPKAKGKRILLVDDICTTGETLRACSYALLNENAASVCAIVVARA